jgi:hypothetical protein
MSQVHSVTHVPVHSQRTQANADGDAGFRSPPADFERRVEDEAGERTGRVEKHGLYVFE